ncbi:MAG: hypothetical protein JSU07_11880 [Bacteroidetes bacterium]|nr:hypothetical protein [Bacteroidota bacterium]
MKKYYHFVCLLSFFALSFAISSCEKKTDCNANITCVNAGGAPVSAASVSLFATVRYGAGNTQTVIADVKAQGSTNSSGTVGFVFKLPAIYDVKAIATSGTGTIQGTGIIKLDEGQGSSVTITMQ